MSDKIKPARPIIVTIIGILYLITGIFAALLGMGLLGPIGAVLGIVNIIIGIGLIVGWKPMWYLGVIFTIIDLIVSIFMVLVIIGIIPLIINIVILYYLFTPKVKLFFGVGTSGAGGSEIR